MNLFEKLIKLVIATVASLLGFASAQTTAYTTPVGYVSLGDTTVGQPAIKANTDVAASIPLLRTPLFSGAISGVSGSDITLSGTPGFTASPNTGSFVPTSGKPYIIQIKTGARAGLVALVTANTADKVTVALQPGDNLTGVANGDILSIREATTVSNLFENSPVPVGTQILGFSGAVPGINLASDLIYEFDGADWVDVISFELANNVVLYPGESFVIRNQSESPISSLVVTGEVNATNFRTVLPASGVQQDIAFSFFGSAGEQIGNSGLGAVSSVGDQILVSDNSSAGLNKAATTIIEFDGSSWIDVITFDDVTTTFKLEPGMGYFLRSAAAGDRTFSDQPDYVPSL